MAKGRRVRRVVRRIDTWSVFRVAALFFATLTLVLLLAGILLWVAGSSVGAINSVEKFMVSIGFENFKFVGGALLKAFIAAGIVLVIVGTGLCVLMAVLYNLISDIVGGIEISVLEEQPDSVVASATSVSPARDDIAAASERGSRDIAVAATLPQPGA